MLWRIKRKLKDIKEDIGHLLKLATYLNFYKLQPFETEIIVELMKENQHRLKFTSDYTIWKLEEKMTDKRGIKSTTSIK